MLKNCCVGFCFLLCIACNSNNGSTSKQDTNSDTSTQHVTPLIFDSALSNIHFCTEYLDFDTTVIGGTRQAGAQQNTWWNKTILEVKFLEGNELLQQRVMNVAKEWEQYCGITFEFNNTAKPDITIAFRPGGCSSQVGKLSALKQPSMNFGWLTMETPENEFRRLVLHEFGHALGLIHEHQNPNGNPIQWNKAKVYQYYEQAPTYWSAEKVDRNVFKTYNEEDMYNGSMFDPKSIMLYAIPKELTLDGYFTSSNEELSEGDKKFIEALYPKTIRH